MSWHVSMCEVGVYSSVVLNLKAGERGPNKGVGVALWPPPIAVGM